MQRSISLPDLPDADVPVFEGRTSFTIPHTLQKSETYYKVIGNLSKDATDGDLPRRPPPLIILHGGPGGPHDQTLPFWNLHAAHGMVMVFYDQVGCGLSTHFPERMGDDKFWTFELFVAELDNLIAHLGIHGEFDLLGHSFGARLASEYVLQKQNKGLRRLVLWGPYPSQKIARMEARRLLYENAPSTEFIRAFEESERNGDYESDGYLAARGLIAKQFLCRADPWPPGLAQSVKERKATPEVSKSLLGNNIFQVGGTLKDWDIVSQLKNITKETLILNSQYDTSTEACCAPFFQHLEKVKWVHLANTSHIPWWEGQEERATCLGVIGEFLTAESSQIIWDRSTV